MGIQRPETIFTFDQQSTFSYVIPKALNLGVDLFHKIRQRDSQGVAKSKQE